MMHTALVTGVLCLLPLLAQNSASVQEDSKTGIELNEQGVEPRRKLTYAPELDTSWMLFVDRKLDRGLYWDDKPIQLGGSPGFRFRIPVTISSGSEADGFMLKLTGLTVELIEIEGSTPEMLEAIASHWSELGKVEIRFDCQANGRVTSKEVRKPEKSDPFFEADLAELVLLLEDLIMPLPQEPVGVNGIWTLQKPTTSAHFMGQQTQRIHWQESEEGATSFSVNTEREFERQSKKPAHNNDLETLHFLTGSETRSSQFDPALPFPSYTRSSGEEKKEVENLLDMLARTESKWDIEAGMLPLENAVKTWTERSELFPPVEAAEK